jgi:hypothetical protein
MKTTNTFSVQFIIRTKKNDLKKALIYARISINGKRIEISLKRIIDPLIGRPRKAIKKDQLLGVKCSLLERKVIEYKARENNLSVSEYLRKLGLSGKVDMKIKILSKEILQFKGTLNHLAANLNQIAKKRNMNDELNAL